jgi:WD40 repeat protein
MKSFHFGIVILLFSLLAPLTSAAQDAAPPRLLPDGLEVITPENAGRLQEIYKLQSNFNVISLAFDPKGDWLISGHQGDIRRWNLRTGSEEVLNNNALGLATAFNADGTLFAYTDGGTEAQVFNRTITRVGNFSSRKAYSYNINDLAFNANGEGFASSDFGYITQLWNIRTNQLIASVEGGCVAFSPSGHILATCGVGNLWLWNAATGEQYGHVNLSKYGYRYLAPFYKLVFHPGGDFLLSSSADGIVRLWRISERVGDYPIQLAVEFDALSNNEETISGLTVSPSGVVLAFSSDRMLYLWDLHNHKLLNTIYQGGNGTEFNSTGTLLATGDISGTIHLWGVPHEGDA